MQTTLYPWQHSAWAALHTLRATLPHALLLHGVSGTGKSDFATLFAQSLLCQQLRADGQPCTVCASCNWFVQYSHPDFRRLRPEVLDIDDSDSAAEPDAQMQTSKSTKAGKTPSKDIRIEQVRALASFMNISTHRNGNRVVLLYPAENLNPAAANALLKTLEEPPSRTVILMVSHRKDRLLPTVLSRCHQFAMPVPTRPEGLAWLQTQQVAQADIWLDAQGGAPLAALQQFHSGNLKEMEAFLAHLALPGRDAALGMAEKVQKLPVPELVSWLQRWLYDLLSCKMSGAIRFYPRHRQHLSVLAARVEVHALLAGVQSAAQRRTVAEHPLAPKLFIEDMLLDYVKMFRSETGS